MKKIEIPHEAVRKRMVPQGGPVIWQTRHNKVKHECASKLCVFSDGEPPCAGHANEYERSRNGLDRFRGCTEARGKESNGADSSPNTIPSIKVNKPFMAAPSSFPTPSFLATADPLRPAQGSLNPGQHQAQDLPNETSQKASKRPNKMRANKHSITLR